MIAARRTGEAMDLRKQALFRMAQDKLGYLGQRHKVLSQNIANADTPNFRPRDLKPVDFGEQLRRTTGNLQMASTQQGHLPPARKSEPHREVINRSPFEDTLSKNGVVLEEQLMKVADTQAEYEATTTLYRKYIDMMKIAVQRPS